VEFALALLKLREWAFRALFQQAGEFQISDLKSASEHQIINHQPSTTN
jgi:hypothetical protein